ncbi:PREDICTED: uncharacterized protein LOC18601952 isoform X2 [Theobroma cacao]|uniref:Uncharacterized protein LOC18601952 isoform X2 n=1 Tax=Theobroma cacao TaxID=3641 RepID=A0AB32W7M3_THECC|nr:PREDICTED: uncharacterized protein LOC18601952 isoform X2 [Theobroma cacao]
MKSIVGSKMASFLPSYAIIRPSFKHYTGPQALQVRAESRGDEGRLSNNVDANLGVLREGIDQVKIKEKLERCCRCKYGWNYTPGYKYKLKRGLEISEFFGLWGLNCATCDKTQW